MDGPRWARGRPLRRRDGTPHAGAETPPGPSPAPTSASRARRRPHTCSAPARCLHRPGGGPANSVWEGRAGVTAAPSVGRTGGCAGRAQGYKSSGAQNAGRVRAGPGVGQRAKPRPPQGPGMGARIATGPVGGGRDGGGRLWGRGQGGTAGGRRGGGGRGGAGMEGVVGGRS